MPDNERKHAQADRHLTRVLAEDQITCGAVAARRRRPSSFSPTSVGRQAGRQQAGVSAEQTRRTMGRDVGVVDEHIRKKDEILVVDPGPFPCPVLSTKVRCGRSFGFHRSRLTLSLVGARLSSLPPGPLPPTTLPYAGTAARKNEERVDAWKLPRGYLSGGQKRWCVCDSASVWCGVRVWCVCLLCLLCLDWGQRWNARF